MQLTITLADNHYLINTDFSWNLAIALHFDKPQPNHFSANTASSKAMLAGNFIGNIEQGGSCNVNELSLNPHCNGTHTETIAHICDFSSPLSLMVNALSLPPFIPSVLITITPHQIKTSDKNNENSNGCDDSYQPNFADNDKVITRKLLEQALQAYSNEQCQAVIIRTLPNSPSKQTAQYNEHHQAAFFSCEAILYLNERGVEHLLVDTPSIDRLYDDGLMSCHHLFWQVMAGTHQPTTNSLINKTITEMIYVDEQIKDGFYFLNLQLPAFANDAAPSRPILYSAEKQ